VPNIQIYLHAKFHNFLRSLCIFSNLFSLLSTWKIDLEKEKGFYIRGPLSATLAQIREATGLLQFPLSPIAAKWAPCARTAHRSENVSLRGPTCQELPSPNFPLPCHVCAGACRQSTAATPDPITLAPATIAAGRHYQRARHRRPACPLTRRAVTSSYHASLHCSSHCAASMPGARSSVTSHAIPPYWHRAQGPSRSPPRCLARA
jgi:hypothetical protein